MGGEAADAVGGMGNPGHSFDKDVKFTCRCGACESCGEPSGDFGDSSGDRRFRQTP